MKVNSGFSLIELTIVIIILGIFAAIAAPMFINTASDARVANVNTLKGALLSSTTLVYSRASIQGVEKERKIRLDYNNDGSGDIPMHSGYPAVWNSCRLFIGGLPYWMELNIEASCDSQDNVDWYGYSDWNKFYFMPNQFTSIDQQCYVKYTEATSDGTDGYRYGTALDFITVTATTDGC